MTPIDTLDRVRLLTQAAEKMKAEEVVVLDLRELSTFTDYFVVASVASRTQMRAVIRAVSDAMAESGAGKPKSEGLESDHWAVLDLGDAVLHLFDPATRHLYNLEGLWGDAVTVDTEKFLTA